MTRALALIIALLVANTAGCARIAVNISDRRTLRDTPADMRWDVEIQLAETKRSRIRVRRQRNVRATGAAMAAAGESMERERQRTVTTHCNTTHGSYSSQTTCRSR